MLLFTCRCSGVVGSPTLLVEQQTEAVYPFPAAGGLILPSPSRAPEPPSSRWDQARRVPRDARIPGSERPTVDAASG